MCKIKKNIRDHRIETTEREYKIEVFKFLELVKTFYYVSEHEALRCYLHFSDITKGTQCCAYKNNRDWDFEVGYIDEFNEWYFCGTGRTAIADDDFNFIL